MAKIHFYVRSKEKGQPGTVYLRYSEGRDIDFWIPTTEKVFPEHWSVRTGGFKQNIVFSNVFTEKFKVTIEGRFSELKQHISTERLKLKGEVTKEWLKNIVLKYYNKASGDENLNGYIDRFINELISGKRLSKGKRYKYSTIKNYKGFKTQFDEFQKFKGKFLNFEDITIDFYNDFVRFFNDKNYSPNTIGRHIKNLKVILRQSLEEGLHNNTEFQRRSFETISVSVDNVYLNESELSKLFNLDLSAKPHLQIARDVFLSGCYTAQRYSDYSKINQNNIKTYAGKKVIELVQQKTSEKCIIPIRPELNSILKRYNYNLPKTHEQKVNKYIKDIGKLAGLTDKIEFEQNKGGFTVKNLIPKYKLIKTHTARRSGCTNMYLAGIPAIDIMKISGHKTERDFLNYIKVTKEQTADKLSTHPYFSGNLKVAK